MKQENKIILKNKYLHDKLSNKYNKRHVEIYNLYEQERLSKTIKKVLKYGKWKDSSVLDFWAWTWNLTHFFLENLCYVTALDISTNSLKTLSTNYKEHKQKLTTKVFNGENIPFKDQTFDIIATYSVLHHIPDYLSAIKEMIRVIKKWWILYIDHEANKNKRHKPKDLKKHYINTNKLSQKLKQIFNTWEFFEFDFWKWVFIRLFINKRFRNEWDIHVFVDDHIERDKIKLVLKNNWMEIIEDKDYLLYNKNISIEEHNQVKDKINDTKYIVAKKI